MKGYVTYANAQTGKAYDLEDNASAATPSGLQPLPSEKVQSIEAGIKSQWLDRRLTVNLSAFRSDYHNYQVQSLIVSNNINTVPTIRLYAIGKVRTQGIELQSSFAVSRALRLDFYATYLDAKIRDYPGAQCFLGQTVAQGCVNAIQNRRGVLPGTSKFRMIASANYTLAMPDMPFDGTFSAFYRYQTETFFDLFGDPLSKQGAYGIVNLSVGAKSHSGLWSAEIFVNNVANRHYYTGVVHDSFQPNGALALHATYGRDANRYFGGRLSFHF